jgi:hypothetical protein
MKSKHITEKKVRLELTEQEAEWLKSYLQNSLCDDESQQDSNMRKIFFDALSGDLCN